MVSVGAVDASGQVAAFSSRHAYLTLTAPGVAIASLGRQPQTAFSGAGTSQATAITSAVLALVWSAYPQLTGRQVVARVLATLRPPPGGAAGGRDPAYGYGVLDGGRAVTADVPADAANPVDDAVQPFVRRAAAAATAAGEPRPAPVGTAAAPPGRVIVGARPGPSRTWLVVGVVAAVLGLLLAAAGTWWLLRLLSRRPPPAPPIAAPG